MSTEPAAQFNIHQAQANLSRLIARVEQGEEIIISRAGKPVARLVPLTGKAGHSGQGSGGEQRPDHTAPPPAASPPVSSAPGR